MEYRFRQFVDNVAANIVSWVIIGIICAMGAAMIALFAAVTHGLSRWEQVGILSIATFVLMGLGLIGYVAYRSTKLLKPGASNRTWPWDVFTIQEKYADLSSDVHVSHKDKIRIVLTNATGKELNVWTPIWESAEVQAQYPFGSKLHLYGEAGWKVRGSWDDGHPCIVLAPSQTFMCWIGLLEPSGEGIIQRLKKENTGTAIFPVKIEGKLYDVPIRL